MNQTFKENPPLYKEKANFLRALSHPQRLCILRTLCKNGTATVSEMQCCLDEKQAVVSQHLAKLRRAKIIKAERSGTTMNYSIYDDSKKEQISNLINLIFGE